jgi:hypothetical protein
MDRRIILKLMLKKMVQRCALWSSDSVQSSVMGFIISLGIAWLIQRIASSVATGCLCCVILYQVSEGNMMIVLYVSGKHGALPALS